MIDSDYPINAVNWKSVLTVAVIVGLAWWCMRYYSSGNWKVTAISIGVVGLLFLFLAVQMTLVRLGIHDDNLLVGGGFYKVGIPLRELQPERARTASEGPLPSLVLRTNGIGLPGLSLGWFRGKGIGKVFAAVTDKHNTVLIPTSRGFHILVSPRDPDAFLQGLREAKKAAASSPN